MPGVSGAGGPPPKRSSQRRRENVPDVAVDEAPAAPVVGVPKANRQWHPVAKRWFESLAASGQSKFYEPSDWATAYMIAESMSREFKPRPVGVDGKGKPVTAPMPPTGASLQAWLKAMTALMVTEGDRRRLRLELVRQGLEPPVDPEVEKVARLHALADRAAS